MLHGIGIDILDISRIRVLAPDWHDPFFIKTFSQAEYEYAVASTDCTLMFAKQFCCKEAVFKALRISPDAIRLDEIETVTDFSSFKASLYGKTKQAAETAGAGGVYFSCSASGGGGYVMAYAVCLKNVE